MQVKPGISTSEFWGKVIVTSVGLILTLKGFVTPEIYWGALAVMWTIYGVERFNLKSPNKQ